MPRAARVARGEKRYDRDGVVVLLMVMVLQCERWELPLWVRPLAHLCNWLPRTVTLIRTKFRYIKEEGNDRPENAGHCFTTYYFLGPSDVRDFFTKDGSISLTAGVEEYFARKVAIDPVFQGYFSYPLKDDKGQAFPDKKQAPEWERRRKEFFRYYTVRASINFSRGSHDEWN